MMAPIPTTTKAVTAAHAPLPILSTIAESRQDRRKSLSKIRRKSRKGVIRVPTGKQVGEPPGDDVFVGGQGGGGADDGEDRVHQGPEEPLDGDADRHGDEQGQQD
jgi:hypothetical protein